MDIADDLYRRIKAKAALEGRKVTEVVEEGLRAVLAPTPVPSAKERRVKLPLVKCKRAHPRNEATPERTAEVLLEQEVQWHRDTL